MELIITEKPSVARAIAEVVGATDRQNGYLQGKGFLVSWCVGHLVELALPEVYDARYARWRYQDLPIIPEKWQYTATAETKKQFDILKALMNDPRVTGIICATDAGREGELIFRLVYQMAQCRKSVRRLWISSMEESAIREGFRNMKPMSAYDNLYQAALCRAQADWLIGMNATRLYSLLYGPTLHIGRVMSPTLAMLAQREKAIAEFRPETFYKVVLDTGRDVSAESERFDDLNEARRLMDACNHSPAVVRSMEHTQRNENPPALYDLTSLQRDANKLYGFTAQQTLDYAQGLYEKKLLTYPRTDSRYLTHDMEAGLPELASRVCGVLPFADGLEPAIHVEAVINDAKVTDHHADAALGVTESRYDLVYSGVLSPVLASSRTPEDILEGLYTRFNLNRPDDFRGHSLSVSDVIALNLNGQTEYYYTDSFGFYKLPAFLEHENALKNAEMMLEDDYNMIDGIVNNGPKEECAEKFSASRLLHDHDKPASSHIRSRSISRNDTER